MAEMPENGSQPNSLEEILADYYCAVDAGKNPDPQDYLDRYPEHRQELEEHFAAQGRVEAILKAVQSDGAGGAAEVPLLPDFQILDPIGPGGMGMVFKAWQQSAKRVVAVKIIRADRLDNLLSEQRHKMIERFITEAQAAARLEHDNIVKVYHVGESHDQPYYAMRS